MNTAEQTELLPLEIRQYPYGWTITCFDGTGHVRHVATADTEIQAYRAARKLAAIYHLHGRARVSTPRGDYFIEVAPEHHPSTTI